MAIKFLSAINLTGLEIQNVLIQNRPGPPATPLGEGQIIYDSTASVKAIRYWNGSEWITLDGLGTVISLDGSAGSTVTTTITGTSTVPIVNASLNDTSVTPGTYTSADITVDAQGRITSASSNGSGTVSNVLGGSGIVITGTSTVNPTVSIDYTASGVIGDASSMSGNAEGADLILLGDSNLSNAVRKAAISDIPLNVLGVAQGDVNINNNKLTNVADPAAAQDAATKNYVDSSIVGSGALIYQGGYNAATNTPVLDSRGTPIAVSKGWTFAIDIAGTFFGEVVEAGDLIIAEIDNATSLVQWTTIQSNIGIASTSVTGIAKFPASGGLSVIAGAVTIPTSGVTAGAYGSANKVANVTVNAKGIVTAASETSISIPASAVINFSAEVISSVTAPTRVLTGTIGSGTSWVIPHNMGSRHVMVQVYSNAAPWDTINVNVERTTINTVTISVATNPGAAAFNYMIQRIG